MAKKKESKKGFTCWHAHDYSTIELNGESYLEIGNSIYEDDFDTQEECEQAWQETVDKVENIVALLNKA